MQHAGDRAELACGLHPTSADRPSELHVPFLQENLLCDFLLLAREAADARENHLVNPLFMPAPLLRRRE